MKESQTESDSASSPDLKKETNRRNYGRKNLRTTSEFNKNFVNEDHVADFVKALSDDLDGAEHIAAQGELLPPTTKKTTRRKRRVEEDLGVPKGISYSLLRYPLIIGIGTIIIIELVLYIGLRQMVRAWENFFSWRGKRRRLRAELRQAQSYEEWCRAAEALDRYIGKDTWKDSAPYGFYDYRLIQKVIKHLRIYTIDAENDPDAAQNLKDVLYACLKQNFAGIENRKLYSNTYLGTKRLIDEYIDEVTHSIEVLARNPHVSSEDKRLAFKLYAKNYGRTALCLSGGAGFGLYHLGVVRELLDRKLLPSIITGTSAGALMGALVCTRTDDELRQVLVPEIAYKLKFCHDTLLGHLARYAKTGAFFDSGEWCRMIMWFTHGSLTFKEAYERTGRIFNVSVIPHDPHSPPKLLNHITAPHCVIWSAVLASAAIPGIQNPVVLMQKSPKYSHLMPYNYGHKFKDGSLRTDIPTQALYNQFNVNFTIVSQVNPHIHLFFYANQGSPGRPVTHRFGKGWRGGFLASACEQFLKLDLSKWLKVVRDLGLLPRLLNQDWSSIWLQKFDGTVTILPKTGIFDWLYIVANPDAKRMAYVMEVGRSRTWPNISMISNRLRIESSINLARKSVKKSDADRSNKFSKRQQSMNTSDDASGSGDEDRFLAGRRASMPDGTRTEPEGQKEEEARRRKFLAEFTDRHEIIGGRDIVNDAAEYAEDSDDESSI